MARTRASSGQELSGLSGREVAERGMREAIIRGRLGPGHRLVEADISEQYGVTRNSARSALDVLAAEGLVERVPNRGARVRRIPIDEAVKIMECRMVLEGLMSGKAAERADETQLSLLQENCDSMRRATSRRELLELAELIESHHALVHGAAQQSVATELVERMQAQIVRHQFQYALLAARAESSLAELERVVAAIVDRDRDGAEWAARAHLGGVIAAMREHDTS